MTENMEFHQHSSDFDLEGGPLCLDFCNTLDWHASAHPVETLNRYADLAGWGLQAGLLSADEAHGLVQLGQAQPAEAEAALADARALREALYRIFVAAAREEAADPGDLDVLTRFWRAAAQRMVLAARGEALAWEWQFAADDLRRVLWHVTRSAVDLLQSEQRQRIGQCEDDRGCGFLFLDTSRNRSRRWCSMESCGNRAKANRHYARARK